MDALIQIALAAAAVGCFAIGYYVGQAPVADLWTEVRALHAQLGEAQREAVTWRYRAKAAEGNLARGRPSDPVV